MQSHYNTLIKNAVEMTLIPGLGLRAQNRIYSSVPDIPSLFSMGWTSLRAIGVPESTIPAIRSRSYKQTAEEIVDWSIRAKCRILVNGCEDYPALLRHIDDAPLVLYVLGALEHLHRTCLSVVGSRRPTLYGLQTAEDLSYELGRRGLCIVSGLARGIDAAAHRGCLNSGGNTIAVLGCGVDRVYPSEHQQLKARILRSGNILSEFPPGTEPRPHNFPVRNRIISGLSLGTLIIEAGEKSGSLITARLALEQNREIFAIPGTITSSASFGTNFLIKQGAKLVQSWKDIIEELPASIRHTFRKDEDENTRHHPKLKRITENEKKLLSAMKFDEVTHIDSLCSICGFSITELSEQLLNLEMEGLIRRLPGDMYILSKRYP